MGHGSLVRLRRYFHTKLNARMCHGPRSLLHPVQWLQTLSQSYTWKLLAMVACTNHLLKVGGGNPDLCQSHVLVCARPFFGTPYMYEDSSIRDAAVQ